MPFIIFYYIQHLQFLQFVLCFSAAACPEAGVVQWSTRGMWSVVMTAVMTRLISGS